MRLRGCIAQLRRKRSRHTDPAATTLAYKEAVSHKKLYQGLPVDQSITVSKYVKALGAMMQSQGWIVQCQAPKQCHCSGIQSRLSPSPFLSSADAVCVKYCKCHVQLPACCQSPCSKNACNIFSAETPQGRTCSSGYVW